MINLKNYYNIMQKSIWVIIFLCSASLYSAEPHSQNQDSANLKMIPPIEKGLDLIIIGGGGISYGGRSWGDAFYQYAPSLALGLEIPFTKAHWWSFEIYGHKWFGKAKSTNAAYYEEYTKLSDNNYTQLGISTVFKAYITRKTSNFRFSFHWGLMLISPDRDYKAFEVGCSLYYRLAQSLYLSLNSRFLFLFAMLQPSFDYTPNLLMLNLNYKFRIFS